jgi:hypothetical protein
LKTVPGVEDVSYARSGPREIWSLELARTADGGDPLRVESNYVGPDYLRVHGLRPLAGRELYVESGRAVPAAVVTQGLADALWPGQPALGRRLQLGRQAPLQEVEVVGVARDALFNGYRRSPSRHVLLAASVDPFDPGERIFYLRYTGDLDAVAPAIGRAIREEDARVPLVTLRTLDAQLDATIWPIRVLTMLLALFAGGSLIIATIGQYAVVTFDMRRRVREFGVRIALGASSRQIVLAVLRDGFRLTAIGLAIGFVLSVLTGSGLSRVLYGITATDPLTYGSVLLLLSAVSAVACYLPALRASRVNPIATLKQE